MGWKSTVAACAALCALASSARAGMLITEWMYSGNDGEYIEFTNTGPAAVDMTGWSFDDDSRTAGTIDLSAYGLVNVGESVILTEVAAPADFRTSWSLPASVKVIGGNAANLSRNDEINLYDNAMALIDRLTYGDQNIPGTIRTQNRSGNPSSPAALGVNNVALWQLAVNGDAFGSHLGALGDLGSPAAYVVPEPASAVLLLLGGMAVLIARKRLRHD
jgi:predicted extracellular nuclease